MSLIPKSVLHQLPEEIYSIGKSIKLRVLTFAGEGQVISATPVKLTLNGFQLKLLAIDADLNNGSGFSFPTPEKWIACTGSSTTSHSGRISILLGSDNPLAFPKEEERDEGGAVLCRSILTHQPIIYGAINPELITWTDSQHKFKWRSKPLFQRKWSQGCSQMMQLASQLQDRLEPMFRTKSSVAERKSNHIQLEK